MCIYLVLPSPIISRRLLRNPRPLLLSIMAITTHMGSVVMRNSGLTIHPNTRSIWVFKDLVYVGIWVLCIFFIMGVFYHHPGPLATMGRCLFQKIGLEKNYYATAMKIFSFFFTMRPWCQPFLIVL